MWIVTFYMESCGYCKAFEPEFFEAARHNSMLNKKVKFGAVDARAERYLTWISGVKKVPTVKVFGRDKANSSAFVGKREAAELMSFIDEYCQANDYFF